MINPRTRVLIVDDQDLVGEILRAMLAGLGITQVEQVKDGWDALLRLRSETFDLALIDLNLGSMSGLQLLRAIRRDERLLTLGDQHPDLVHVTDCRCATRCQGA